jgi:hypothetical protein
MLRFRSLVPLLGIALLPPAAGSAWAAGDLLWPTDAGRCVTSAFCEFRPGHFHSGIDISTWGKVGYRCLAVADGDLVRARVACGGYGRALYLRLPDGRTAVYAHLSRFEGALADTIRARQAAAGSAYLDLEFPPGAFPVRRGETVGRTGQSGVGVPHLHFELRDADSRALDPLREGLRVADGLAPVITRLALTPLTPASSVDGRSETVILDVHPTDSAERGVVPRTIPCEGEVGIAVEVDETTDACRFMLAPHRIELHEGDETLYAVEYDGFSFGETGLMDFQIDPRFSYPKVGRFHLVWRRPGNALPFSPGDWPADGVLRAGRGPAEERRLRRSAGDAADRAAGFPLQSSVQRGAARERAVVVVAEDAAGNRGRAEITLSFGAPPEIAVLAVDAVTHADDTWEADLAEAWTDTLEVVGAMRAGGREPRDIRLEWSPDAGATWLGAPPVVPDPDGSFSTRIGIAGRVPGEGPREIVVRAQARDVLGATGLALSEAVDGPPETPAGAGLRPEIVSRGGWAEIRFDGAVPWGALSGGWELLPDGETEAAVLVRPYGRGVRIVLDARPGLSEPRVWSGLTREWKGIDAWGRPVPLAFRLPAAAGPDRAAVARAGDVGAEVELPVGTFAEPAVVAVRQEPPAGLPPGAELVSASPLFTVDSGSVPFAGDWVIRLGADAEADVDPERVALFVQEPDRFRYIGGERDGGADPGRWIASARTVLPVGLFEDAVPPVLGAPRLEERYGHVELLFSAEDLGAGLDCEAVEVLFDGEPIPHELDDETGDVVASPPIAAEAGAGGVFEIRAVDRCGNPARRVDTLRFE